MAGFDSEAIQAAMPDMLNLALANNADLARTADISSNILSGFGLDPKEMQRVADVLTATTTRANVDLSMLGESMKFVAPQARAMNMSLEQSAAMAGLLGNVGIQASQAGTTMRAMVTRLAAPVGAAAGALETLGVNAKDAQGNLRDVPKILADVARATDTMGTADRAGFLKTIFGEEPGAGMAELIAQQGTAGIEAFVEVLSNSMGEAAQVAKVRADNIGGDLKGLRSAWEDVGISITETNKGPIRDLIQNITSVTRGVSAWIEANPELAGTIAKVAAGVIALSTAGGALTMTLAGILSPLLFARFAMTTLGIKVGGLGAAFGWIAKTAIPWVAGALKGLLVAMGPIGWGVMAIAATALVIYKYWEPIKAFFVGLWEQVKGAFSEGVGGVATLLANWSPYGLIYNAFTSALERLGVTIPEGFSNFGSMIVDGIIGGITGKLGELRESVTGMASNAMGWFKGVLDINSPSRVFAGYGNNITQGLSNGIQQDADNPLKQVRGLANNLRTAAGGLILGAGLSTGAAANVDTSSIQIDARPPLQSHTSQSSGGLVIQGGINIQVHAAPGMDEQALARLVNEQVQRALQQAQQQAAAANRRNFHDND
jgi:TP901 family phage tail tape measure protein